jgi:leucyl aminopeptidase
VKFSIDNGSPVKQSCACVVVGVFETRTLSEAAKTLDKNSNGYISNILNNGDMEGKLGSTLLLHNVPNTTCNRILLVGLGEKSKFCDREYQSAVRFTFNKLYETGASNATLFFNRAACRKP